MNALRPAPWLGWSRRVVRLGGPVGPAGWFGCGWEVRLVWSSRWATSRPWTTFGLEAPCSRPPNISRFSLLLPTTISLFVSPLLDFSHGIVVVFRTCTTRSTYLGSLDHRVKLQRPLFRCVWLSLWGLLRSRKGKQKRSCGGVRKNREIGGLHPDHPHPDHPTGWSASLLGAVRRVPQLGRGTCLWQTSITRILEANLIAMPSWFLSWSGMRAAFSRAAAKHLDFATENVRSSHLEPLV